MSACAISPADRRWQVRMVGNDLLKNHGKKRYSTVQEVKDALGSGKLQRSQHTSALHHAMMHWSDKSFAPTDSIR